MAQPPYCATKSVTVLKIGTPTKLRPKWFDRIPKWHIQTVPEMIWPYSKVAHPNCVGNDLTVFQSGTSKLCQKWFDRILNWHAHQTVPEMIRFYSKVGHPNCATNSAMLFQINTLTSLCQEWFNIIPNWHTHQPVPETTWKYSKLAPSHVISLAKLILCSTRLQLISSGPRIAEIWSSKPDIYCTVTNPAELIKHQKRRGNDLRYSDIVSYTSIPTESLCQLHVPSL